MLKQGDNYASLGGRDDLQMAGSFSRKIRIWSEIRASCQCNVRTFFLHVFATFCHIQKDQRVGRFADRTGAESKSLVLFKWIVLFCAFMMFQEKWADMNFESPSSHLRGRFGLLCVFRTTLASLKYDYNWARNCFRGCVPCLKHERTVSACFSFPRWFPIWMLRVGYLVISFCLQVPCPVIIAACTMYNLHWYVKVHCYFQKNTPSLL